MITDASQTSQFFSFAQQQGLQRAYLHVDADIDNSYFGNFIQQCNASGIAVEALMGNAQWILGGGTPSLQSNLEWIDQYQGNASADARFSGIHMDIEVLDSSRSPNSAQIRLSREHLVAHGADQNAHSCGP